MNCNVICITFIGPQWKNPNAPKMINIYITKNIHFYGETP